MRRLIVVLLAAMVVGIAPASRAVALQSTNSSLHGTVTFWNAYSPDEQKVLEGQVIPAFEAKYPGVKVTNLTIPYNGMFDKLITAAAGGTGPDVVRSDIIWVPQLANINAIEQLDKYPWFQSLRKQVFNGNLRTNYFHGHYYGLPLDTNTRILFYNKSMFAAAGISSAPATTQAFAADCAKIKTLGSGKYCYAEGGFGGWNLLPWVWTFGGNLTNKSYTKASGYLNSKATLAAVNFLLGLYQKGELSPNILGGGIDTWSGFGKEYAMIVDGPWTVPALLNNEYPSSQYGAALMPKGPGGSHSVVGGEDIVMMRQSHNKAADAAFIQFMLSKQAQVAMGKIGQMPVLASLARSTAFPPYYSLFQKQLKTADPRTPSPQWANIDDTFSTAVENVFRGNALPKAALDQAARKIDGLLK
jgi:multiple sugar transport system substrate-binding protein